MQPLTPSLRAIFVCFAALAFMAGVLLFIGADRTEDYFAWTIEPPLTAATLGAFYWAALVLLASAARAHSWAEARPAVYPVALIALLLLATTLIHLERFDLDSLFGWFWLIAYCLVPLVIAFAVVDQLRSRRGEPEVSRPEDVEMRLPAPLSGALVAEGLAMIAIGAVLLISPEDAGFWPWALTPLTSRAIGAFVIGIGLAALTAALENDLGRFRGAAYAYGALGALELLAAVIHSDDFGGDDLATAIYVAFLVAVLATGAYASIAARASARS
jgi:membrane protein CcdC involved in cytochrome C biogenesis